MSTGGAYGYARVTLGPFAGYFVGSCESMQIVLFVVLSVLKLSSSITELTGFSYQYEPCYWSIFFVATISSQIFGRKIFWRFILLIATVVMAILVTYCCALAPYANFEKNATVVNHAADAEDFFQHFPLAALFFVGIEFMPLACTSTQEVWFYLYQNLYTV